MTGTMAKQGRIRITVEIEDRYKRAFLLWAAAKGLTPPEAFTRFVSDHMGEYLKIADREIATEKPSKPK